jgi:hypothetical protein
MGRCTVEGSVWNSLDLANSNGVKGVLDQYLVIPKMNYTCMEYTIREIQIRIEAKNH